MSFVVLRTVVAGATVVVLPGVAAARNDRNDVLSEASPPVLNRSTRGKPMRTVVAKSLTPSTERFRRDRPAIELRRLGG
jgi:hypothetical protein